MLLRAFLSVLLAHLLADFLFQTSSLVRRKQLGNVSAYATHGLTHYLSAILLLWIFVPGSLFSPRIHLVVFVLTLAHLLIDYCKIRTDVSYASLGGSAAYIGDQLLHVITILAAACMMAAHVPWREIWTLVGQFRATPNRFFAVPIVYIAVVFGGGYLVRLLTLSLAEGITSHSPDKQSQQLQNAGLYIGWLERFVVLTALLLHSPALVGLVFTAKAIARYPEFKSERFAEYFLIGTLVSISLALVGGAILVKALFGEVRFT